MTAARAFYNEIEAYPARWLQHLEAMSLIAPGDVYKGDIRDIDKGLDTYTQCHFFAGIGVWSYAFKLIGWPDDLEAWTGSCPCQPFSVTGKRKGKADERHLWPEWLRLIKQYRPPVIFGEQVASPDGRAWLDDVSADLEALGYAVGSADLCAAGVDAPHIRQRLFFGAILADAHSEGPQGWRFRRDCSNERVAGSGGLVGERLVHSDSKRGGRDSGSLLGAKEETAGSQPDGTQSAGPVGGFWTDAEWVECTDGFARPAEPGTFPLAHGSPTRVGRIRAYGNAIVPQVAAVFIQSFIESIQ